MRRLVGVVVSCLTAITATGWADAADNTPPPGFVALFNGKDDRLERAWLLPGPSKKRPNNGQAAKADSQCATLESRGRRAVFDGKGQSLCTAKDYGDFEVAIDWKILPGATAASTCGPRCGWETPIGSGRLYNNQKNPANQGGRQAGGPVELVPHQVVGEKVWVWLNGELVVVQRDRWRTTGAHKPSIHGPNRCRTGTLWFKISSRSRAHSDGAVRPQAMRTKAARSTHGLAHAAEGVLRSCLTS